MQTRSELDAQWSAASELLHGRYMARVRAAIEATANLPDGYWIKTLERRLFGHPQQAGSYWVAENLVELDSKLRSASWWPYPHVHVMPGCTAFKADIPGYSGIIDLHKVSADTPVELVDHKETGEAFAEISGFKHQPVAFSVIILGMEEGKEVVFTVHPGNPAPHIGLPMELVKEETAGGTVLTPNQAIEFGLTFAAIV